MFEDCGKMQQFHLELIDYYINVLRNKENFLNETYDYYYTNLVTDSLTIPDQ